MLYILKHLKNNNETFKIEKYFKLKYGKTYNLQLKVLGIQQFQIESLNGLTIFNRKRL